MYMNSNVSLQIHNGAIICVSLFQLALIHSPPLSEIFVFTDASPKDSHLYSTVKALILEKQSKVKHTVTNMNTHEHPHHENLHLSFTRLPSC